MDGADLTVRPGGHVEPGQVERDLPLAVKAFEEAGLNILMMVSNITDADDPLTEQVLRTASELGIRYYRMGYYSYDHEVAMQKNLDGIRKKMDKLAALNEKYQIHGAYQNHAGDRFGAPVWDLWEVIRNLDPRWTGCQFDVRHATAEGRRSWPLGLRALKDYIQCLVVKDFSLEKKDGKAGEVHVPLGEGIVDFPAYFKLLEELEIRGPISVHIEYPMFPKKNLPLPDKKARAIELMRKDLNACKSYLKPYESK
jgi:sugar phosphate isomerase/epimerase